MLYISKTNTVFLPFICWFPLYHTKWKRPKTPKCEWEKQPSLVVFVVVLHFSSNKLTFHKHFNVPWNWKRSSFVSVNIDFIICLGFVLGTQTSSNRSQFFVICPSRFFAAAVVHVVGSALLVFRCVERIRCPDLCDSCEAFHASYSCKHSKPKPLRFTFSDEIQIK